MRQGISESRVARMFLAKVAGTPQLRESRNPELREGLKRKWPDNLGAGLLWGQSCEDVSADSGKEEGEGKEQWEESRGPEDRQARTLRIGSHGMEAGTDADARRWELASESVERQEDLRGTQRRAPPEPLGKNLEAL